MGDAADSGYVGDPAGGDLPPSSTPASSSGPKFSPAGAMSIASLGLGAFSGIQKARGTQAADEFQAAKAKRAADFGRLQAGLTDTVMRENFNTMISNIDVIRAAAHADPTSPTGAAIEAHDKMISDRSRTAALLTIKSQIDEDEASAAYLHKAGLDAVANANLMAGLSIPAAVAKAFPGAG